MCCVSVGAVRVQVFLAYMQRSTETSGTVPSQAPSTFAGDRVCLRAGTAPRGRASLAHELPGLSLPPSLTWTTGVLPQKSQGPNSDPYACTRQAPID